MTWLEQRGVRGEILDYTTGRIRAALHGHESNVLSLLDLEDNLAVYWVERAEDLPWYETGAPLRILLYWWFSSRGLHIVHGGAIGTEHGGVLLGGKGGSGKSTTALACLKTPLSYAGDDYTLIALEPQLFVYSLYNTAKVKGEADLQRFPWMSSRICNAERIGPDGEKPMLFLHEHQPDKIASGFPLKAIAVPHFVPGRTRSTIASLAPQTALRAIAQSTITQLTGAGREALRAMSQLVHRVPCYTVELGEDLAEIPAVMQELLAKRI
jgi:hypothetical protein